ncbi:MFS transporter [Ihubacter sp. rT4E-8]|uniref:MFS transporter n=1 Tax=Ihubacter sp. rT4E-8 TaxID=3242369 RepID=UPI003CEC3525
MLTKDIVLILAASFFYMASPMLITPLITGFSGSIGASAALMGMIGGLMNLCALFCRPSVGNLADRCSKYKVTFIGAVLMTLACLGYVFAPNPGVIFAARIVNGVGFACCSVCLSTWMSNLLPKEKIGSGMGFYGMMNALAMAAAPAIGVSVYQIIGYRAAFLIALACSVAVAVTIQFVKDKGQPRLQRQENAAEKKRGNLQIADRKVIPIAMMIMLFAIPYCATQSFLVTYVEERSLHVSVSLFFPLYAIILLILRFAMKNLFDRLPFHVFFFGGLCCAFASILLLGWMHSNIFMFLAALFMAGGYGIMCSVCQSTAILLAGEERRGLANSTYYIGLDLGMSLGPVIGGFLYGNLDLTWFYPALLLTIPLNLFVYIFAKKRRFFDF